MISLETRLTNVENMLRALISKIDNDKLYQGYNDDALRTTDSNQEKNIAQNTADVDYIKIMEDL